MSLYTNDEITINAPTHRVWNALLDPALTQKYMFGCKVVCNWKVGDSIEWIGAQDGVVYVKGELVMLDPEKTFSFTVFDPNASYADVPENYLTATYTLTATGDTTQLKVTQGDYNRVTEGNQRYQDTINQGGWSAVLSSLKQVVENSENLEGNTD